MSAQISSMTNSPISPEGRVLLVGAGPGDPGLLTLKAARALEQADVVVHDGLVDPAIIALANPAARYISVAKQRSHHSVPQEGINAILVAEAQLGHLVVRLKAGDPFIFGRGGEEVEACRAAGVLVEVIPGVSAALGCAAEARSALSLANARGCLTKIGQGLLARAGRW
jgi:uroporphyrin-III C-methyltransferase